MKTSHLAALAFALSSVPLSVFAQDASALASPTAPSEDTLETETAAPTSNDPSWRLDVLIPTGGLGWFGVPSASFERGIATVTFDVRLVGRNGQGAMLRPVYGTDIWGEGWGVDLAYVYRSRLIGNDDLGLGLDLSGGMTAAYLEHGVSEIADDMAYGGNVGASLDFRAYNFAMTFGVQYRMLLPTQLPDNGLATGPEHVVTFTFGGGFGFSG